MRGLSDPHPKSRTRNPPISWKLRSRPQWAMGCLRHTEIGTLCSGAQRRNFFCTASWMQRRLTRNALAAKGRTGPTAGETGPRCGRTCGATRQQRKDDSLRISNDALKKGGRRQNDRLFLWQRAPNCIGLTAWANHALNLGKICVVDGPRTRPDRWQVVAGWTALPPISCAPRD